MTSKPDTLLGSDLRIIDRFVHRKNVLVADVANVFVGVERGGVRERARVRDPRF